MYTYVYSGIPLKTSNVTVVIVPGSRLEKAGTVRGEIGVIW